MDISEMTVKQFRELKHRKWDEEIIFDCLIILPGSGRKHELHDSGYRCMDFVAVNRDKPLCLLSGCSDVIHINGIGGFGYKWLDKYGGYPKTIPPVAWSIDCLAKSGLLRLFTGSGKLICGTAFSSFEIYNQPNPSAND